MHKLSWWKRAVLYVGVLFLTWILVYGGAIRGWELLPRTYFFLEFLSTALIAVGLGMTFGSRAMGSLLTPRRRYLPLIGAFLATWLVLQLYMAYVEGPYIWFRILMAYQTALSAQNGGAIIDVWLISPFNKRVLVACCVALVITVLERRLVQDPRSAPADKTNAQSANP